MTEASSSDSADRPDLEALFLADTPLMDVRAEVEFDKGAFPTAINRPLLRDAEREQVGTCYKQSGQDAAIELGHQLVAGATKEERIRAWCDWARANPEGRLYCFRGGLRSRITQGWMREAGVDYPLIEGGYKAMRAKLIREIERAAEQAPKVIISGRTGTGKTLVLTDLPGHIDLEGLAEHRGSAFGRFLEVQPTQINFENRLAIALLKHRHENPQAVQILEDESRILGSLNIPFVYHEAMKEAPIVVLDCPMDERLDTVLRDYFTERYAQAVGRLGEERAQLAFSDYLLQALDRIRKRLGGERHQQLRALLQQALPAFFTRGDCEGFRQFIETLLTHYYDPMYDYQLGKKTAKVLFRGNRQAVRDWLIAYQAQAASGSVR